MKETDLDAVAQVHRALVQSHEERCQKDISARKMALKQLRKGLIDNEERIYQALSLDLGRPRFESLVADVAFIRQEIDRALKSIDSWCKPQRVKTPLVFKPGRSYIEPTPKGVVLIIGAWNYPFQLSLVPLVSAIAAGNCAIVKPSEIADNSAVVIADIVNNYLDQKCFRALIGDAQLAKSLLALPFDHIFYTGSTAIGKEVMASAAHHLTPVTLELGGKSPVVVDKTCDLFLAVKRILWGKCLNAGQTCIAPDYVLLEKGILPKFIELARSHLLSMFGKDIKRSASFARIINDRHFKRLVSYLDQGTVVVGGHYDQATRFIEPTILVEADMNAPVMQDEIFGPILPVITIEDYNEAIGFISHRPHPLALYIFSNDKRAIKAICDGTISGGVAINDCLNQVAIMELPFGGVRHSGIGGYHGVHGFETFSHPRAVFHGSTWFDNSVKYPPYSDTKLKVAKLLL